MRANWSMFRRVGLTVAGLCVLPVAALSQEVDAALVRLQAVVSESLYDLPDYTCRLDIRRVEAGPKRRRNISLDKANPVSLDVAFIDGKERYALPGSATFSDQPPSKLITEGMVSSGAFAAFARDILVNRIGKIHYVGEDLIGGEPARRYDYSVGMGRSQYRLTNNGQTAIVPYHGSFWSTGGGEQLLRLTARVDEIPFYLGVKQVVTQIDYQTALSDERIFIVPKHSRVNMLLSDGGESINEAEFVNCRSFGAESTLRF